VSAGTANLQTVQDMLAAARAGLSRLDPRDAYEAVRAGAVLVDIRPAVYRKAEGTIPGALIIERNDLEWRLDPTSDARMPLAAHDLQVIVVCTEGYASSLAAAALQQLGLRTATDLIGGFRAWRAAGLPVLTGGRVSDRRPGATPRRGSTEGPQ
jgi:rhodanese-related sulfurtransferase